MPNPKLCPKCESEVPKSSKFCLNCGEPIYKGWKKDTLLDDDEAEIIVETIVDPEELSATKASRKKLWILLSSGFAVVLLIIVAATIYVAVNSASEENKLIILLEKEASQISLTDYPRKVRVYKRLLELRPRNDRYAKLLSFYEGKLQQHGKAGTSDVLVGFDSFPNEIEKANKELSCLSQYTIAPDAYSGAQFNCVSGLNEKVLWTIAETSSGEQTHSVQLVWNEITQTNLLGVAQTDKDDAVFAVNKLIEFYAPENGEIIMKTFFGTTEKKLRNANFIFRYHISREISSIDHYLTVMEIQ